MKAFACACSSRIFFDNFACLACQRELGFVPSRTELFALSAEKGRFVPEDGAEPGKPDSTVRYRKCANCVDHGVCNWLVQEDDPNSLCPSCRLNRKIPDLSLPDSREHWIKMEQAKRRLICQLLCLRLPVVSKVDDPEQGLAFDIVHATPHSPVMTGHARGLITLNAVEADPVERERARVDMGEGYRTLLGHLRHESGHYYWERLISQSPRLEGFREMFGDERRDYSEALEKYYCAAGVAKWSDAHVSAYAVSHPWEDWSETWAHYLHALDTLETAYYYGFSDFAVTPQEGVDFERLVSRWIEISVGMNELGRSMGQADSYPFAWSPEVTRKMRFVHETITEGVSGLSEAPRSHPH